MAAKALSGVLEVEWKHRSEEKDFFKTLLFNVGLYVLTKVKKLSTSLISVLQIEHVFQTMSLIGALAQCGSHAKTQLQV